MQQLHGLTIGRWTLLWTLSLMRRFRPYPSGVLRISVVNQPVYLQDLDFGRYAAPLHWKRFQAMMGVHRSAPEHTGGAAASLLEFRGKRGNEVFASLTLAHRPYAYICTSEGF